MYSSVQLAENGLKELRQKTGLEKRIRDKQRNLMKIGGDTLHVIHHAAREMSKDTNGTLGEWLEHLFNALYVDFKHKSNNKQWLQTICYFLGLPQTSPGRFVSNRWLNMYEVSVTTLTIWDGLLRYNDTH